MKKAILVTIVSFTVLAGCGGGGGSDAPSGSAPVANAPTTPAPTPTTPTAPVGTVQTASLQTAVAANYAAGSEQSIVFNEINSIRVSMGLGPVLQNANIDLAAKNHQAYVALHQSGADPHAEVVGKAGFTGVTSRDRVTAAGYVNTYASEGIAFPGSRQNSAQVLMSGIYHRSTMLEQGFTHVGIAASTDESPTYVNYGQDKPQRNAGDYVGVYPVANQSGVPLTHGLENPNPFYLEMAMTPENMCTKTSYPVSIFSEASTTLSVTNFTVTEEGASAPMDVRVITRNTSVQDAAHLGANEAHLVAKSPFKANTKYNVRFVGKATGAAVGNAAGLAIDKAWSFTTGIDVRGCQK